MLLLAGAPIEIHQMFNRIGLVAKPGDVRVRDALRQIIDILDRRGLEAAIDRNCAELLGTSQTATHESPGDGCDLVIAVGGDGTMLNAARALPNFDVPLLGVNLGRLGFLADLAPDSLHASLTGILDGQFVEERRFILRCSVQRDGECISTRDALNDVVVNKWHTARLISIQTYVDDVFVSSQRSDGLIISTPTGSTAYALAGGGPILHPALDAVVLVPICPHTLTHRPIAVPGDSRIRIVLGTHELDEARTTVDGEATTKLAPGDEVLISKSGLSVRLLHPAGHDYFAVLRAKLHWGTEPC
jgi:NAD+ kinase